MRGCIPILCALLFLLGCSGSGGGNGAGGGAVGDGGNADGPGTGTGDTITGQSASQEITVPMEYFQIPCGEIVQTGPNEVTLQISPSDLDSCSQDSSFHFPISLMATAYAQENLDEKKLEEILRIRLRCQYPIRIEGKRIIIQVPSGISIKSPEFEKPSFVVEGTQYIISVEVDETQPKEPLVVRVNNEEGKAQGQPDKAMGPEELKILLRKMLKEEKIGKETTEKKEAKICCQTPDPFGSGPVCDERDRKECEEGVDGEPGQVVEGHLCNQVCAVENGRYFYTNLCRAQEMEWKTTDHFACNDVCCVQENKEPTVAKRQACIEEGGTAVAEEFCSWTCCYFPSQNLGDLGSFGDIKKYFCSGDGQKEAPSSCCRGTLLPTVEEEASCKQLLTELREKELRSPPLVEKPKAEEPPPEPPLKKVETPPVGYFENDPCTSGTQLGFCEPLCAKGYQCVVASQEGCWKCAEKKDEGSSGDRSSGLVKYEASLYTLCLDAGPPVPVGLFKDSDLISLSGEAPVIFFDDNYYGLSAGLAEGAGAGTAMIRLEQRVNAKPPYTQITLSKAVIKTCIREFPGSSLKLYAYSGKQLIGIDEDPDIAKAIEVDKAARQEKPPVLWDGDMPLFANEEFYSGPFPECFMTQGNKTSYESGIGALLENALAKDPDHYSLILGEEGRWNRRFLGPVLVGDIQNSNEDVAQAHFHRLGGLVVHAENPGETTLTVKVASLPADYQPDKYRVTYKEMKIDVHVIQTETEKARACPGEAVEDAEELVEGSCCPYPKTGLSFQGPIPGSMPLEAQVLADSIYYMVVARNQSHKCDLETIARQARKIATTFYAIPNWTGYASCVDCARSVSIVLEDNLKGEPVSCIEVQNIMSFGFLGIDGIWEGLPYHSATVVGPAGSSINNDWLVLDTIYFLAQNPFKMKHEKSVKRLGEWRRAWAPILRKTFTGRRNVPPEGELEIK